jgi:hypothetical protein
MALTAGRNTAIKQRGREINLKLKASTTIYIGSMVAVDTNGLAVPASNTASYLVIGRADGDTVTSAASGDYFIRVNKGVHKWANSSGAPVVQATVGKNCLVEDDQTVTITASNNVVAGVVDSIDADGGIWVSTPNN